MNVLPVPMISVPALAKSPAGVKLRPFSMVKLPAAALVVKLARASLLARSTICATGPSSTRVAAFVRISALAS